MKTGKGMQFTVPCHSLPPAPYAFLYRSLLGSSKTLLKSNVLAALHDQNDLIKLIQKYDSSQPIL